MTSRDEAAGAEAEKTQLEVLEVPLSPASISLIDALVTICRAKGDRNADRRQVLETAIADLSLHYIENTDEELDTVLHHRLEDFQSDVVLRRLLDR